MLKWMWNGPQKGLGMKFSDTPLVDNHGFFVGLMLFFFIEFHFPNANFQQGNKIRVKYPYKYIQKNNRRLNSKQTRQFNLFSNAS